MESRRDILIISRRAVPDVNLKVRCNAGRADKKVETSKVRTGLHVVGGGVREKAQIGSFCSSEYNDSFHTS